MLAVSMTLHVPTKYSFRFQTENEKTDTSLVFSDPAEDSLTEILEQLEKEAGGH